MSSLVSGRPETSLPAEESAKPTVVLSSSDGHDETGQTDDEGLFIPHVFDLIWHTRNAAKYVSSPSFPSLYLEPQAVDTSTLIGDGASFTVSRRSIPKDSSEEYATNGFVDRVTRAPSKRPDYVVYKTARIAFTPEGEAVQRDRRAMASVMMEIYALVHPPLLNHPNVVSYVGLAWGSNPYEPTHRLPILVVEHADYGTLAGLQEKEFLPSKTRQSLCLDVALGLDVLHRCGIVHGDVKAENVLIFANLRSQYPPYIAKVADFGFSTVEAAASIAVNVGGTRPWKAPETDRPVPRAQLRQTDVYSFGLLVWRVGTDGKNPFEFLASPTAVEQLKQSDELLGSSKVSGWYPKYVSQRSKFYDWPIIPMRELLQNFRQYLSNPASTNVGRLDRIMSQLTTPEFLPYTAGFNLDIVQQFVGTRAATDPFYGKLDELFRSCLCLDPDRRNMADVIALLQTGLEVRPRFVCLRCFSITPVPARYFARQMLRYLAALLTQITMLMVSGSMIPIKH